MIKVSIITPIYNVDRYIARCVNSILMQSYTGSIECIFIDDCSPCKSVEIIEDLITEHPENIEFKILRHDKNRGASAGRNTGLKVATGDYIYFLDSDDDITTDCIENLVKLAEKYQGVDFIQGRLVTHFDGIVRTDYFDDFEFPEYSCDKEWIYGCYFPVGRMSPVPWNKLIRRDFIINNGLWFKEGVIHEDVYWTQVVAAHINTLAFCHIPSYKYRDNPASVMANKYQDKMVFSWLMIFEEVLSSPPPCLINSEDIILKIGVRIADIWRQLYSYPLKDICACENFYKKTLHRLVKSPNVLFRYKIGLCYMLLPKRVIKMRVVSSLFKKSRS